MPNKSNINMVILLLNLLLALIASTQGSTTQQPARINYQHHKSTNKTITPEQIDKVKKGIQAGHKLADLLQSKASFCDFVDEAEEQVPEWVHAVDFTFEFIGSFVPNIFDEILDEIKQGFAEVNMRLDVIISELQEIKRIIKWADMKVKFADIEYRIRLMDDMLKNTLQVPKSGSEGAKQHYVQSYTRQYNHAGFALYDAIANNDQIFSSNLLTAAIKYSRANRKQTQQFSKSLFGLLMKAASVELAYGKFAKVDFNQRNMWNQRLKDSVKAMKASDNRLANVDYIKYYKEEVESFANRYQHNKNHNDFATALYDHLEKKYYWRYWLVAAFNPIDYPWEQASVLPTHGHRGLRRWNRSYFVVSTDPANKFLPKTAAQNIHNVVCTASHSQCNNEKAVMVMRLTPHYGQARFCFGNGVKHEVIKSRGERAVAGVMELRKPDGGFYGRYRLWYFG